MIAVALLAIAVLVLWLERRGDRTIAVVVLLALLLMAGAVL